MTPRPAPPSPAPSLLVVLLGFAGSPRWPRLGGDTGNFPEGPLPLPPFCERENADLETSRIEISKITFSLLSLLKIDAQHPAS